MTTPKPKKAKSAKALLAEQMRDVREFIKDNPTDAALWPDPLEMFMKQKKTAKAKYTFEIYRGYEGMDPDNPMWYWRCRHRNGNIVCDGAEGYSSKAKLNRSLGRFTWGIKTSEYEIKEL